MIAWLQQLAITLGDLLFGWTLTWGADIGLLIVSVLSAMLLIAIRYFSTPRDLLLRIRVDHRVLRRRIREAKKLGDTSRAKRMISIRQRMSLRGLKWELPSLLLALPIIGGLACWAGERLAYHPLRAGDELSLQFQAATSAESELVHIRPQHGMVTQQPIVELKIHEVASTKSASGSWQIQLGKSYEELPSEVVFVFRGQEFVHPMTSLQTQHEGVITTSSLQPVCFFGLMPSNWFLPPWMLAYLAITLPLAIVLRKLLRVP